MNTKTISLIGIFFFLYLFFVYDTDFHGPDEPIYCAYTASIVEDGDLNAVNHLNQKYPYYLPDGKVGVSKTYNLPDYHNHGGVIFWVPFYLYAKFAYFFISKFRLNYGIDDFINCSMSFSTILFGFLAVLLTFLFCKIFFSWLAALWSTLIMFLGTPFFYFLLSEVGNAQILAMLLSILSIWFCSYVIGRKKSHWFLYGLFLSMCVIVKIDLWFQIFFIICLFIALVLLKQIQWKYGVYFLSGLVPGVILKIINDFIKYGTLHLGEFKLLNFKSFYFLEQLFSSYHGFCYTSPVFYLCLFGLVAIIISLLKGLSLDDKNKMRDVFLLFLSIYLFMKIFILSFRYAWGGGTPGARILLTEFPVFVLLYARALQTQKRLIGKVIFVSISVLFVFWNLIVVSEFIAGVDLKYMINPPSLYQRIQMLKLVINPLFYVQDMSLKLYSCLPLLPAAVLGIILGMKKMAQPISLSFWYYREENKNRSRYSKIFILFTVYSCLTYLVITVLNVHNNKRNVEKMQAKGVFKNAEVIQPKNFEKMENIGSLNELIEYYTVKGDISMVNKIRKLKKKFYN